MSKAKTDIKQGKWHIQTIIQENRAGQYGGSVVVRTVWEVLEDFLNKEGIISFRIIHKKLRDNNTDYLYIAYRK